MKRMIAKLPIRPLSWSTPASTRFLSTVSPAAAAAAAEPSSPAVEEEDKKGKRGKHLYRRISELGGAPEGEVSKVLNKWVREGRPVKALELVKHVRDLRKYKRYNHALELMEWMENIRGMNMSYTNHAIRLDLIAKVRGIESAENYFNCLPESAQNQQTYGALFSCYCSEKMEDKVTALYQKMKELNLVPNSLIYNNLMAMYMKLGQHKKVPTVLDEMKATNVSPNSMTYCILMNSYASLNDIESVERVMHQLEEAKEVVPHWIVYSTLAGIYNSAGLFEKTELALKKLEKLIDRRDREPFHFLISLYAGAGNLQEVHRVWKSLKSTFTRKQTNMSYLTMLQALNKLNDMDGLKSCYTEWESGFEYYDVKLTNLAIGAHLRNSMVEEAESLIKKAKEKGGMFDFRTCDLFIDYYLRNNEIIAALTWLEAAVQIVKGAEWKLGDEKIDMFMKHYEKEKDVDGAEEFCTVLKALDCLNSKAYESLLRTYVASGRTDCSLRKRIEDEIEVNPEIEKLLDTVCGTK